MRFPRRIATLLAVATLVPAIASPAQASTTGSPGVKSEMAGLVTYSGGAPPADYSSAVTGWVVTFAWSSLQPDQGGPIDFTTIDEQVAAAQAGGAQLKLRILAGIWAPDWAKTLDGAPMNLCDANSSICGTVGRYWTANYMAAYDGLMAALAARYDGSTELAEVAITRCTTIWGEPMLRQIKDPNSAVQFRSAGYTLAADQQCQTDEIAEHDVWKATRSALAFNPYQEITPTGTATDEGYTESLMGVCRATLADRCVLGNNSLSDTSRAPLYDSMYAHIKALGAPIYFQTAQRVGRYQDLHAVLNLAISYGAAMVELPTDYAALTPSDLSTFAAQLRAQAVTAPPQATVSDAPTIGVVTAGNASAVVSFVPPATDGGSPITDYTVTSNPGGITASGPASPITVTGLTNGAGYTFTVHASNAVGNSPESEASDSVTPAMATLSSITVTPANPNMARRTNQQLMATGTYSDGSTADLTSSVTWSSSNTAVAIVTPAGLVATKSNGASSVSATQGSIVGSTAFTVGPAFLTSIVVTPANPGITRRAKQQFTAIGTYSDGSTATVTGHVTWSSSATAVATIRATGMATGRGPGTTTVTASSGPLTATTTLTVT